ncbi:hypothetical protein L484_002779 [Morus notabilis]|uniref:LysM domain-containing protein n=1 Tax=Morus notabilis TaxID=981085 RepID=W9QEJ8_9ROSA|nr:hypothetical protein L484_002779 [Morus notabilis]
MAADAKLFDTILFGKARKQANNILRPQCKSVFGVRQGDTCFAVSQMFNLTLEFFDSLNPNLNCTNLFVGEWLCVDGTPNYIYI